MEDFNASETLASSPDEQPSFEEMWDEAAKQFERICGESLMAGEIKSFGDLERKIGRDSKASYGSDEPQDKWEKAKSMGLQALKFLKLLVGAASQASSFIPIPDAATDILSSALGFLLDIPQAIKDYDVALNQIFGEVSSALSQFRIYRSMDRIHPELIKQIHSVLVSFVKICAHVVRCRQGGRVSRLVKKITVAVFKIDSGLEAERTEFRRVVQQQRDVESTVTLKEIVGTRRQVALLGQDLRSLSQTSVDTHQDVQDTKNDVKALKDDADRIRTLTKIRDALSIPETVRFDSKTTQQCTTICKQCLPDTGKWIWEHPAYQAWTDSAKDTSASMPHVLLVTGPPSSGKTSVNAQITRRLEGWPEQQRIYVAHYFFRPSAEKSDNTQGSSVADALKYMAFQIARVDDTVRNSLGEACKDSEGESSFRRSDSTLEMLWANFNIGGSGAIYCTGYYLVFSGIEHLPDDQIEILLKFAFGSGFAEDSGRSVRVLLSGTDDRFENPNLPCRDPLRIRMEESNKLDLEIYVKNVLSEQTMFKHPQVGSIQQQAYDKIVDKLPKNVKGSYSLLKFDLEEVTRKLSTRSTLPDLDDLLDHLRGNHEAAINALQRSLTSAEIDELNELLKWVLFSREPLMLDQLEAVLFLLTGKDSIASLQDIIQSKYAAVLDIKDSRVVAQDGVKKYLEKEQKTAEAASPSSPGSSTISMTINIQNAGQEMCANFLWDLAHRCVRDRFDFKLDGASSGNRNAICVDEFDVHRSIVQKAFEFLNAEPRSQTAKIGKYLVCWLPYHLRKLKELEDNKKGRLTEQERIEIGQKLYTLFRDADTFQRHKGIFVQTHWTAHELRDLLKWLRDSAVMRQADAEWYDEMQQTYRPTRGFLKGLVTLLVNGLLRERTWDVSNARVWLQQFMALDGDEVSRSFLPVNSTDQKMQQVDSSNTGSSLVMTWDGAVSTWCQSFLKLSEKDLDSLWYERLAEAATSRATETRVDPGTILALWKQAIDKENPSWRCYRGLGLAYFQQKKMGDAIEQMKLALEKAKQEAQDATDDVFDLNLLLGKFMLQTEQWKPAADYYREARNSKDPEQANSAQVGYFMARLQQDAGNTRELLQECFAEEQIQQGIASVADILKTIARDSKRDELISKLFTVASSSDQLMQAVAQALKIATTVSNRSLSKRSERLNEAKVRGVLLYHRGVVAHTYSVVATDEGGSSEMDATSAALQFWRDCRSQLADLGGPDALLAQSEAVAALARHYFQTLMSGQSQEQDLDHLKQLANDIETDASTAGGDALGFLGVLYMHRGEPKKAKELLGRRFRHAMQILSDDLPENDRVGFSTLRKTLELSQDFKNASIALMLEGQPDLVTEALHPEKQAKDDSRAPYRRWVEARHDRLLQIVARLATETVRVARTEAPKAAQQLERLNAAQAHIDTAFEAAVAALTKARQLEASPTDGTAEVDHEDAETILPQIDEGEIEVVAHGILQKRLKKGMWSVHYPWKCSGRLADGTVCPKKPLMERVYYACMYCMDRAFCWECLQWLRDPDAEVKITVCDATHQWLKVSPPCEDIYVGPLATSVRVPQDLRAVNGDEKIREIWFAEGTEENVVNVEEWKRGLAKEWGIDIDEL
ncbi:hypothetical protein FB45DRAFT_755212 [Roridomyces roridus]|uniref:Fungal STAND N-terminal Goodbye domain-containing protein n=1 Tax=Roridomyces roridus TaxID=1738132 RepID=A0AAD7FHL5_9AGAR|nr:hypothetical protein FB45DRAFT_755212 [Roridomyces roridus]